MYGYFRPYDANLTHTERQLFNAYYCRICYCLRLVGGQLARFCTTYDGAVYALILSLQTKEEKPPILPCERLGKKNLARFQNDDVGLRLARLSLIAVGEKLRDDHIDDRDAKSVIASRLFAKALRDAKAAEPEIGQAFSEGTDRINALQDGGAPLFEVLGAYGDIAARSFSQFTPLTEKTEELIRSVAEWTFLADMVADYADDYKSGSYNGFKTEGLPTFPAYFNVHYHAFLRVAATANDRMLSALMAVRDDSTAWNTLFKIIIYAIDNVIPSAIEGEDIEFHYFSDLFKRIAENRRFDADIKRLRIEKNEKD